MPLYEFECKECGKVTEVVRDMNDRTPPVCHGKMRRKFSPFRTIVDFRDGYDIGAGKYFNTARERDYHLAKNNLRRVWY